MEITEEKSIIFKEKKLSAHFRWFIFLWRVWQTILPCIWEPNGFSIPSSKLENVSNFQPTRLFQFELHKINVKEPPWVKEKVEKSDKERDIAEMRERERRIEWERELEERER